MQLRNLTLAGSLIVLGLCVYWLLQPDAAQDTKQSSDEVASQNEGIDQRLAPSKLTRVVEVPEPNDPRVNRLPDGRVEYLIAFDTSMQINQNADPLQSIYAVEQLFADYRYAYKENPVGSENAEITQQLLGKNPKRIVFIDPRCAALRGNQLVDQWGSPFFFHAVSGQQMQVRSAGPDRQLWTADDVLVEDS
ncbi:MAG: hypothetical protein ABS34_02875 [Opitutaceae bacterium BACL24 MAG-120322-bin51]|jgi:hypothetical protein|nr:MAG: hypothetical protein ABS34_02875 [Opitutaceae bacterium BACL24 MAG-120322-bin51]